MREIPNEQFIAALQQSSDTTKQLIRSTVLFDCLQQSLNNEQLSSDLLIPISDYLLGLVSKDELLTHFAEIGVSDPQTFLSSLNTCISTTPIPPSVDDINEEIEQTEEVLESLISSTAPASSMTVVQNPDGTNTYSSSQSSVLQQKNTDEARWGQV